MKRASLASIVFWLNKRLFLVGSRFILHASIRWLVAVCHGSQTTDVAQRKDNYQHPSFGLPFWLWILVSLLEALYIPFPFDSHWLFLPSRQLFYSHSSFGFRSFVSASLRTDSILPTLNLHSPTPSSFLSFPNQTSSFLVLFLMGGGCSLSTRVRSRTKLISALVTYMMKRDGKLRSTIVAALSSPTRPEVFGRSV